MKSHYTRVSSFSRSDDSFDDSENCTPDMAISVSMGAKETFVDLSNTLDETILTIVYRRRKKESIKEG
jgi:hypothetical protein